MQQEGESKSEARKAARNKHCEAKRIRQGIELAVSFMASVLETAAISGTSSKHSGDLRSGHGHRQRMRLDSNHPIPGSAFLLGFGLQMPCSVPKVAFKPQSMAKQSDYESWI
ncbi:uncharacterized protein ColSpa_04310 [Colletotrichum spaethianum]|uniref:Uncharacterized protein n=1 Tax=Colletotrichum spaethianum TaxID=700344 RepID=A0AA37LCP5_9PEZI|nr:uncharacterized protein ColSpa_04310 [Colletotrichum spaethianum]GKT44129.1 hypothetical protein ColSpa_04310 [Colletotrichum spaethianum]